MSNSTFEATQDAGDAGNAGIAGIAYGMADFAMHLEWAALPPAIQREAVRAWTNWVGVAVAGAQTDVVNKTLQGIALMGAEGNVRMFGRRERASVAHAAMVGCMASTAHTYDDTHFATTVHPAGPVASALMAVAQVRAAAGHRVAGTDFMAALAAGMELECRASVALIDSGAHLGWFMTGLTGAIGAAVAAGLLLGLTREQQVCAIGYAATHAGGFRATHGSMGMVYVPGMASHNGVVSAYLAAAGLTFGPQAIEGRNGLLQVFGSAVQSRALVEGLASRFEFVGTAIKPFPCGFVIHAALDACMQLVRGATLAHADIARIDLRVHPNALALCWRKHPGNVFEAQVSLYHWVAAAFVHRAAGVAEGELACVFDPAVRELQTRTFATEDARLADNQAEVVVTLRDGRNLCATADNCIGSVTHPMSDEELSTKFRGLVDPVLGPARSRVLLGQCSATASLENVAELMGLGLP